MAFGDHAFGDIPFGGTPAALFLGLGSGVVRISFGFTIYAATAEFITEAGDTPEHQPFFGTIDQPLNFTASSLGSTIGHYTAGQGEIDLVNVDAT